jgi:F0F1-type ATP synthase membrane subunit c/vacuolar-type H+-ATPase subunit K
MVNLIKAGISGVLAGGLATAGAHVVSTNNGVRSKLTMPLMLFKKGMVGTVPTYYNVPIGLVAMVASVASSIAVDSYMRSVHPYTSEHLINYDLTTGMASAVISSLIHGVTFIGVNHTLQNESNRKYLLGAALIGAVAQFASHYITQEFMAEKDYDEEYPYYDE